MPNLKSIGLRITKILGWGQTSTIKLGFVYDKFNSTFLSLKRSALLKQQWSVALKVISAPRRCNFLLQLLYSTFLQH